MATDLQTVALITSWRWLAVGLTSVLQLLGLPASLWPISASEFAEALLCACAFSREVDYWILLDLGLLCGSLDQC